MTEVTEHSHQYNEQATRRLRRWIEEDIVDKKLCPPLVRVMYENRTAEGKYDWNALEKFIAIQSYVHLTAQSEQLVQAVAGDYVRFLVEATQGSSLLTSVFVLPNFKSNHDYDTFMEKVKSESVVKLIAEEGHATLRNARTKIDAMYGRSLQDKQRADRMEQLLHAGFEGQYLAASLLIENSFNPVYFYGQDLSNKDIAEIPEDRGRRARQKILSRAPYYLMQVVNVLQRPELDVSNKSTLYQRNTDYAMRTNPVAYGKRMNRLRNS